jgi:hypothetical protein
VIVFVSIFEFVLPGLVPGIPLRDATLYPPDRDGRDEPGHDELK